jgi:hypothetical protein
MISFLDRQALPAAVQSLYFGTKRGFPTIFEGLSRNVKEEGIELALDVNQAALQTTLC